MPCILQTKGLTKLYGAKAAVDHVDMHVERGDIYGFIGKNGAGKTTTMKLILGTVFPNDGQIELFGRPASNRERRRIGSLIEAPGLYHNCTAYENMLRFSILFGGNEAEIRALLELVGLADTGKKKAGAFSLGMRQRLGIAVAMLGEPELLVLDEPVNGLDPSGIKEVRDTLRTLNREKGVTILVSSHLLGELAKISTRYGIIRDGVLVEELSAEQLASACGKVLTIRCAAPEQAQRLLRERFGVSAGLAENGTLTLTQGLDLAAEINAALVGSGLAVSELRVDGIDMEDYFIERIGR